MFLVAGLALAGLAGIAAAFYFSIRSGNRGSKRLRSAGAGRADAGRLPGSRGGRTARPDRTDNGRRAARSGTGPDPVPDFGDQVPASGRRGGPGGPAARLTREAHAAETAKSRRRVGFRKGADLDEELWPTEAFGGVSDEQFWDDLASDKPLTTTARTAQQDPGTRNRPLDAGPATDPQSVQAGDDRKRNGATRDNAPREDRKRDGMPRDERGRGEARRGPGSGAYPGPRTAPSPATERTAIQPAHAAPSPATERTAIQPADAAPPQHGAPAPGRHAARPGARGHQPADERRQPAARERRSARRTTSAAAQQRRRRPADQRGLFAAVERAGRRPVRPQGQGPAWRREFRTGIRRFAWRCLPLPVPGAVLWRSVPGNPDDEHPALRGELRVRQRGSGAPAGRTATADRHPEPCPA